MLSSDCFGLIGWHINVDNSPFVVCEAKKQTPNRRNLIWIFAITSLSILCPNEIWFVRCLFSVFPSLNRAKQKLGLQYLHRTYGHEFHFLNFIAMSFNRCKPSSLRHWRDNYFRGQRFKWTYSLCKAIKVESRGPSLINTKIAPSIRSCF